MMMLALADERIAHLANPAARSSASAVSQDMMF
jgi:hypothetical protein